MKSLSPLLGGETLALGKAKRRKNVDLYSMDAELFLNVRSSFQFGSILQRIKNSQNITFTQNNCCSFQKQRGLNRDQERKA